MALIHRFTRLLQADLHAVLDSVEEPQALLQQSVREMEAELQAGRQRLQQLQEQTARLERRRAELAQQIAVLDGELDICFASAKEDLARGVIRRKLQAERLLRRIDEQAVQLQRDAAQQQARFDDNSRQFETLKQRAELLELQQRPAGQRPAVTGSDVSFDLVDEQDVEVALLRERQKRSASAADGGRGHE